MIQVAYYTIPSAIVLIGVYFLISRFLQEESTRLELLFKQSIIKQNQKISLPIRYQAYERLALLLERMHPLQVISRHPVAGLSAKDYKNQLILDINTEYQYNLTQQVYVSSEIWQLIIQIKEQMQILYNEIYSALPQDSYAEKMSDAIIEYVNSTSKEKIPTYVGLKYLKNEVAKTY